jgi:hypothetical protein
VIDVRDAHYKVLALKRTDAASVHELDRYILLKSLYRLRSAFDPGLRPLTDQQINNLLDKIRSKCYILGIDEDLNSKIHTGISCRQKVEMLDQLIAKCWRKFRLQNLMARATVISITALIGAVLMYEFFKELV